MFIPDVLNTLLMGLILMVIVVTVIRPIMLNLISAPVEGEDIQKIAIDSVNKHLMRHAQEAASKRTAQIRYQKLLLELPEKPVRPAQPAANEELLDSEVTTDDLAAPSEGDMSLETPNAAGEGALTTGDAVTDVEAGNAPTEGGSQAEAADEELADGEIEIQEGETLAEIKERLKREQKNKKPVIPPELLNSANSYEDKVGVVRMVVHNDQSRVASVIRGMIQLDK